MRTSMHGNSVRVMIAPDSFGETLSALQAAQAIAQGWGSARPGDDLILAPQSDGGPGFVDVLASAGGQVIHTQVSGPLGEPVRASWLLDGASAYLESAQACGLGLLGGPPNRDTALAANSRGVGELVHAALAAGARRVVVGLGGSSCTDGGRGLIDALGGFDAARRACAGRELVAATDVENPLLGPQGAAHIFGPQKGAGADEVLSLEAANADWAAQLHTWGHPVADLPGAGAAGGIGAALLALGAVREPGAQIVADRVGFAEQLANADLLITGEGRLDRQTLRGKAVAALAAAAKQVNIPVTCLAGQVQLPEDALHAAGIAAAHSLVDHAGSLELALNDAQNQLAALARTVAAAYSQQ